MLDPRGLTLGDQAWESSFRPRVIGRDSVLRPSPGPESLGDIAAVCLDVWDGSRRQEDLLPGEEMNDDGVSGSLVSMVCKDRAEGLGPRARGIAQMPF